MKIAVNLSARMLQDPDIEEIIGSMLADAALPASALTLEITESAIMVEPERAISAITRLCSLGLGLSIDDFGTGYSNLAYLKDLPASELKIDKSFVIGMQTSVGDRKIVESTIGLAHNLGLKVVAEGVEDADTVIQLEALGCEVGQGYYFGRPMPPAQFDRWLERTPWGSIEREDDLATINAEVAQRR